MTDSELAVFTFAPDEVLVWERGSFHPGSCRIHARTGILRRVLTLQDAVRLEAAGRLVPLGSPQEASVPVKTWWTASVYKVKPPAKQSA